MGDSAVTLPAGVSELVERPRGSVSAGPAGSTGPTGERGGIYPYLVGQTWQWFRDEFETVAKLAWPASVATYESMRSDTQIESLLAATTWPIRRYRWQLAENGARPEVVALVASDLGLEVEGQDRSTTGRRRGRFSHDTHLRHALLSLTYGFAFFETVGEVVDGRWRMRKLAARPAATIGEIGVHKSGELRYIRQNIAVGSLDIPEARLVPYVWDAEPGSWVGRSLLRGVYRHWLIKDRLLRIDVINHEKAGGVPIIRGHDNATQAEIKELSEMAQSLTVGEAAGGAIPAGAELSIHGTMRSGQNPVLDSIRYSDEQMARRFLAMFLQLGQTETGSRALGDSFIDWFSLAQETIAAWYASVTNDAIECWVGWNWGDDVAAPRVMYARSEGRAELSVEALTSLIKSGALVVDDELREWLRDEYGLPEEGRSFLAAGDDVAAGCC